MNFIGILFIVRRPELWLNFFITLFNITHICFFTILQGKINFFISHCLHTFSPSIIKNCNKLKEKISLMFIPYFSHINRKFHVLVLRSFHFHFFLHSTVEWGNRNREYRKNSHLVKCFIHVIHNTTLFETGIVL